MRVFLDNNLSHRLAKALNVLVEVDGDRVVHLRELFDASTPDEEWLRRLSSEGDWIVLSGDIRIHKNKHQRVAWRKARLTSFFLAPQWTKLPGTEKAGRILLRWRALREQARLVQPGAAFEVPLRSGSAFRQLPG